MYQNVISSPYPIMNPVQMQAPVNVLYPSNMHVPPANLPAQNADMRSQIAAEALANYNKGIMFSVKKTKDGNYNIKVENPMVMDATEYEITSDGSLISHGTWQKQTVIKDKCDILKNAYNTLENYNTILNDSYNRVNSYLQSGQPIY